MEQYEADKQRAIDRVRKMLALANDAAATEGERDNALRMAHNTLAKYNLSIADAGAKKDDRGERVLTMRSPPWARTVASAVGSLFFCEYFYIQRRGDQRVRHYFIGREANAVTAMEIAAFVIRSIQNESGKRRRDEGQNGEWQTAFIKGAAHKVYHRCAQLRREAEEQSRAEQQPKSTGTSLVLASVYATELTANQRFLQQRGVVLRTAKARQANVKHIDAYAKGTEYGAGVSLHRQVK